MPVVLAFSGCVIVRRPCFRTILFLVTTIYKSLVSCNKPSINVTFTGLYNLTAMKTNPLLLLVVFAAMCWSCNDQCTETRITRRFTNVTHSLLELRTMVKKESPRSLERPGKMYIKGDYLFVNEIKEGIH